MNSILSGKINSLDQFNAGLKQQLCESSQVNLAAVSHEQSADITSGLFRRLDKMAG